MKHPYLYNARPPIILFIMGLIFFSAGTIAFAAVYNIDTNDGSISEWAAQGVPVFQTDAVGDTQNGGAANDDIVQTWVATGNGGNTLYFLMKLNAAPALNANNNRAAVASIDCDNDGVDEEPEDRLIVYYPGNDWLIISQGNQSYYTFGNANQGQRADPPEDDYIEWSVNLSQLPPDSQTPGVDCRGTVGIRFATADNSTNPASVLDDTGPLREWNTPTAIHLKDIQARHNAALGAAALIALLGLVFIGGSVYAFQRIRPR